MKIKDIITNLDNAIASGQLDSEVKQVTSDSTVDGAEFIKQAINAGAVAIVAERAASSDEDSAVAWVQVKNATEALANIADLFYNSPSKKLSVIGVTGTNGKTTTTSLIHHVMKQLWRRAGLIGTIKFDDGAKEYEATHTTPAAVAMHKLLGQMADNACRGVIII